MPSALPAPWSSLRTPDSLITVIDPPWVFGPHRGSRIDLPLLSLMLRRDQLPARTALLADIPDDDASLAAALDLPEVVGALAVACAGVDVWIGRALEHGLASAVRAPLRRSGGTELARFELRDAVQAERFLLDLQAWIARGT